MTCGSSKRRVVAWLPPPTGMLKFNVDGAAKGNRVHQVLEGFFVTIKGWCFICSLKEWGFVTPMRPRCKLFRKP